MKKIKAMLKWPIWFFVSVVLTGGLIYRLSQPSGPGSAEEFTKTYPLIDISRNFIAQEDYLTTLQPLRDKLNQMTDEFGRGSVSIYVEFLNTGANISISEDVYIASASLPKLPIAMAVMKKIEDGEWSLANELVLLPVDKDDNSGSEESPLWKHPVGTRFTIEELLKELLINSDNTAQKILFRNMHADEIDRVVVELGLSDLFDEEGRMSAKEYSRFFRSLYTANFLNRENSQKILEWLDQSSFNEYLSHPLPSDVSFPHKYGENINQRVYADSGIVYVPQRPYLISVMVQGNPAGELDEDLARASEFMRTVSRETYDYLSK